MAAAPVAGLRTCLLRTRRGLPKAVHQVVLTGGGHPIGLRCGSTLAEVNDLNQVGIRLVTVTHLFGRGGHCLSEPDQGARKLEVNGEGE